MNPCISDFGELAPVTPTPALDEPFQEDSGVFELVSLKPVPVAAIVTTPMGEEVVLADYCEEPTLIMNQVELAALIADSCPHRHSTVRSMHAVSPIL